ncbi:sensor domain-containing protein [Nocardioides sp. cx-173]|uniref:sensor histidine kinase n=1 Tax=Nocardioides sp. cx-173 TaxID=2898796 RepID=UPI001E304DB8|nr:sensor domain-containing protein [Nocardioides sp. cx-173]MCD4524891.1 sensor domain-containing protein [Nocardioides sp. cx-173]UGB43394.1 sensor domain-containing protein [Nocardioides sp. cx-173]
MSTPSESAPPGRLRLTAYAAAQLVLAIPALAFLILAVVGTATLVVWVGIVILAVAVPCLRWIADRHRVMAARVLGVPVPRPYRPVPRHPVQALLVVLRDPMTWRDLAWAVWASTFGFVLALVCVLELALFVLLPLWAFGIRAQMEARSLVDLWFLASSRTEHLEQRVQVLTETRADAVDHSAAELRRLERDLHDGAQARLVALSMSLGLADQLLADDPEAARRLVNDARETTSAAIGELRSVVRGIHPPVLADRGLVGAAQALALDMAVPVDLDAALDGRPPAPVESAVYFAIAECLANVGKHARAQRARITLTHESGRLRAVVGDDGCGGADPAAGSGMLGIGRRLAAFDGTMSVSSPSGGPTVVTREVPCDLSSPRTMPSSAPG